MRPVVGVCCRDSVTLCARCPRGPPEEGCEVALLGYIEQCSAWDGVFRTPLCKNVSIISRELAEGCRAISVDSDAVARGFVGIPAHLTNQACFEYGLLIQIESREVNRSSRCCPSVQKELRLTVQPICTPIRGDISSVSPN